MKIGREELEHLAELARIDIKTSGNEEELLKSIQDILNYVEELNEVDTSDVLAMDGGTLENNIFRADETREDNEVLSGERANIKNNFPDEDGGYLKVPAIFE